MPLRRHEATQRGIDLVGSDPRGVEEAGAFDELHDRAAGGGQRTASVGVEPSLDDVRTLDPHGHAHQVAAGGATGRTRMGGLGENALTGGGLEVLGKQTQGGANATALKGERPLQIDGVQPFSGERKPSLARTQGADRAHARPRPRTPPGAGLQPPEKGWPQPAAASRELGLLFGASVGVLRERPRPRREWDSRPGGVRLNLYGRLAYRLGPWPRLPPCAALRYRLDRVRGRWLGSGRKTFSEL
jgi:hypothetical protein